MNVDLITASFVRSFIVAIGGVLGFGCINGVHAQESDHETVEEIIVTGSRIPRDGFETLQPATVLDSENLQLRGTLDIAKVLNEQVGFATNYVCCPEIGDRS